MGELILENDQLQMVLHEEGRINVSEGNAYEYFMKDHLGNVRVSFTSQPKTELDGTGLEAGRNGFGDGGSIIQNTHYNKTAGGNKSLRLSAAQGEIVGLGHSMQVLPGDTLLAEVYALYPQMSAQAK
ncbi:hypothetical protein [Pararhodonellum marinum]|uniref:hypothetical protein n=1 Tax=Pararhodonellum marinum TaxID=2755358 RepID=UPI00188FF698|nr:hypothetical protein [Pararhodonellum marinum]